MENLINVLKSYEDFVSMQGASKEEIQKAEYQLSLSFAKDYADYLAEFGVACSNGHELTGITKSKRLSVIDVTLNDKKRNPSVPVSLYVVEDTGIDKTLIWQNKKGKLFQTICINAPISLKETLADYIKL